MSTPTGGHWTMPDLYLTVNRINLDGEPHLDFILSGNKLGRPSAHMGTTPVGSGYSEVLNDVLAQWEALSQEQQVSLGCTLPPATFRQKGARLFELVLPEDLQRHLWAFRNQARDLMIESSEPIPWELMHLQDPDSDAEDNFLCLRYHLARWLPGDRFTTQKQWMPALSFKIAPLALVQGYGTDLSHGADELDHLMNNHPDWKPQRIESSIDGVMKAMINF